MPQCEFRCFHYYLCVPNFSNSEERNNTICWLLVEYDLLCGIIFHALSHVHITEICGAYVRCFKEMFCNYCAIFFCATQKKGESKYLAQKTITCFMTHMNCKYLQYLREVPKKKYYVRV